MKRHVGHKTQYEHSIQMKTCPILIPKLVQLCTTNKSNNLRRAGAVAVVVHDIRVNRYQLVKKV